MRPSTLTALCLFVDVEVGHVTEERIEEVAVASVDSSIYSMVAVAGAFDVGLRGFILEGLSRDPERYLSAFLKLAEYRVLERAGALGEGRWWRWLRNLEDLHSVEADQLEFTREVLGSFPVLDQTGRSRLRGLPQLWGDDSGPLPLRPRRDVHGLQHGL